MDVQSGKQTTRKLETDGDLKHQNFNRLRDVIWWHLSPDFWREKMYMKKLLEIEIFRQFPLILGKKKFGKEIISTKSRFFGEIFRLWNFPPCKR